MKSVARRLILGIWVVFCMTSCDQGSMPRQGQASDGSVREDAHRAPPPAPILTQELLSSPSDAEIIDAATKQTLGRTPWRVTYPIGTSKRRVLLTKEGFESKEVELSDRRSEKQFIELRIEILL